MGIVVWSREQGLWSMKCSRDHPAYWLYTVDCNVAKSKIPNAYARQPWSGVEEPNRTVPYRTEPSWAELQRRPGKPKASHVMMAGGWMRPTDGRNCSGERRGSGNEVSGIQVPGPSSHIPGVGGGGLAHTEAAARPLSHATDQMTAAQDATRITDGAQTEKNQKEKRQRHGHGHWDWHKPEAESENKTQSQCLGAKPIKAGQHVSGILCPLNRLKLISYNSNLQDYSLSCLS